MQDLSEQIPINPLGLTCDSFIARARDAGFGPGQAREAYRRVFRDGQQEVRTGRRTLARAAVGPLERILEEDVAEGTTTKFLQQVGGATGRLATRGLDALTVESVVIPMVGRRGLRTHTLCVSSQVGCAMGCAFCETAQMGHIRNLSPDEIVGQWFAARHLLPSSRTIDNIVFMGMGEPLDNFDAVAQAIRVFADHDGPAVGAANITVSTVGRIDGLAKLAEFISRPGFRRLGLAVSINAPNDQIRSQIMPINRAMPMADLRDALLAFPMRASGKICFEYVLIPAVNDAPEHARELAHWLKPFAPDHTRPTPRGLVNLIPYNPRRNSPWPAPSEQQIQHFMACLLEEGVYVKRRRTKGRAMMGACGQLGAAQIRSRRLIEPTHAGVQIKQAR